MSDDTILIVDDESDLLEGLRRTLASELDCRILTADSGPAALEKMSATAVDVVLTDIRMPEMNGLDLLHQIKQQDAAISVIIMTAYANIEGAVTAIKAGAYDFIQKPLDEERLVHLLQKGLERNRLVRENARLLERMCLQAPLDNMVGRSRPMQQVFNQIRMLSQSDVTVLVQGETGTGKDLAARAIHGLSRRRHRPLVTVNCPALPEAILESELFGYRKGAFTNASQDHDGLFDQAQGGTIFLDEIGDLSPAVQTKLLRVLQEKEVRPLGAGRSHTVDVRIVAATNRDLAARMTDKTFREDLYYRLNVAPFMMPPLREIREDIPLLVDHFLDRVACENQVPKKRLAPEVMNDLLARDWPGNVRELENLIRGWYATVPTDVIDAQPPAVSPPPSDPSAGDIDLQRPYQELKEQVVARFSRDYLQRLLERTGGNVSLAAQVSGMKRQSLQKIIKRYGISVGRYRP